MSPTFTADDVGKPVETATGGAVGVVSDVDAGTAYVEPAPEMADSTKAARGWTSHSEPVPLADDAVDRISDDAVHLSPEFPTESLTTADESADASREEMSGGGEGPGYEPGEPVADSGDRPSPPAEGEELEAVEEERRRELEVDPTELTDRDPEIEVQPDEDAGRRTDAEVDPEAGRDDVVDPGGPTTEDGLSERRSEGEDETDDREP